MLIGLPIFIGGGWYGFLHIARNPVGILVGVLLPFALLAALFVVLFLGWGLKDLRAQRKKSEGVQSQENP